MMPEYLAVHGGTISYEAAGFGPLIVLAHGLGDSRTAYRAVMPPLVAAGYRVAAVDLRRCGESSVGWPDYGRTAIAGDLLAVIGHLGGPATLVGQEGHAGHVAQRSHRRRRAAGQRPLPGPGRDGHA
jgi:pimeloyl-ACP methyl ester carboxylesterase